MPTFTKYLTKGIQSALDTTPVEEGKLRFTIDTGRLFLDNGSNRIEFTDFVKGYTEDEIKAILAPLPKFYYASDTGSLFTHNGDEWIKCCDKVSIAERATYASTATYSEKTLKDATDKQINTTYAPLNSPIFTGVPSVPTPSSGSNDSQVANTEFVARAIASAVSGITQFKTEVVSQLPETGKSGTIYFVSNSGNQGSDKNIYNEYLYINGVYEQIGTTSINLTGYFNSINVTGTGNAITGASVSNNGIEFRKDASFLTEHPSIGTNSTTGTLTPTAGSTVSIIDSISIDNNGHTTSYRIAKLTLPNSVSNASTATYALSAKSISNEADLDFGDLDG